MAGEDDGPGSKAGGAEGALEDAAAGEKPTGEDEGRGSEAGGAEGATEDAAAGEKPTGEDDGPGSEAGGADGATEDAAAVEEPTASKSSGKFFQFFINARVFFNVSAVRIVHPAGIAAFASIT